MMNKEITTLIETYQKGLNEANINLIRSVYADDAMFIGQPFSTATGVDSIVELYGNFLSQLDFNVKFDIKEIELDGGLGFIRTHSHGSITPKGKKADKSEGNREIFIVKRIDGSWKIYRYIFNAEV